MTETPRFKLPLLSASQAQKHVTHNEALLLLDLLVGIIPVTSRALSTPGGAEPDGTVMILAGTGTGAWDGFEGFDVALKIDGSWRRVLPTTAMIAAIADEAGKLVYFDGAAWADVGTTLAGGQIPFPAVQSPSADPNTLDDYEEGSWTPGVAFGGASVGVTYGANNGGRYTKVGRLVVATCLLQLTSKGSSTGAATLTGLPFASIASPVLGILSVGWAASVSGLSGTLQGTVASGGTTVSLYASSGGSSSAVTNSNFSNTSQISGVVTYEVA
jgi:hypothetical protein